MTTATANGWSREERLARRWRITSYTMRRDDAFAELKTHLYLLGGWVLVVRAAPYVLHLAQRITSSK